MSYQIKELLLDDGDSPFAEWFGSLEAVAAAKVTGTGNNLSLKLDYATKEAGAYPIVLVTYEIVCSKYSDAKTVAVILTKHISRYGKITPLPERNLIVVEDQPAFVARIEELHEQVDLPPRQILIEAKILKFCHKSMTTRQFT